MFVVLFIMLDLLLFCLFDLLLVYGGLVQFSLAFRGFWVFGLVLL